MKRKKYDKALKALSMTLQWGSSAVTTAALGFNTVVIAKQIDDIISLDPAEAYELTGIEILANTYDRIMRFEPTDINTLVGGVAESDDVGVEFAGDLVNGTAAEAAAHVAAVVGLFFDEAEGGAVDVVAPGYAEGLDVFADGFDRREELALFDGKGADGEIDWGAFLQKQKGFEHGDRILAA